MDERLRFVARRLDGEKLAVVCREFGIRGLEDRSRCAYRHPNKLPFQIEKAIVRIKQEHASWGAPKIRDKLARVFPRQSSRRRSAPSTWCWIATAW